MHLNAGPAQALGQHGDLGGLATPLASLKGDETPAHVAHCIGRAGIAIAMAMAMEAYGTAVSNLGGAGAE
jgi:hypothetical protein